VLGWCVCAQPLMVAGQTLCPKLNLRCPVFIMPPRSKEARQKSLAHLIFQAIQESPHLQDILVIAVSPARKAFFISQLCISIPDVFAGRTKTPADLFDILTIWFGKYNGSQFNAVEEALQQRRNYLAIHRSQKHTFIHRIRLDSSPDSRDAFLGAIKIFHISQLGTPYPSVKHWICETDDIDHKWRDFLHNDPKAHPDRRRPRLPIFRLDHTKLQLDIKANEDALVYDETSNELLMVVIRNFGRDPNLLKHIEGIIKQSVDCRRSIRVINYFHS